MPAKIIIFIFIPHNDGFYYISVIVYHICGLLSKIRRNECKHLFRTLCSPFFIVIFSFPQVAIFINIHVCSEVSRKTEFPPYNQGRQTYCLHDRPSDHLNDILSRLVFLMDIHISYTASDEVLEV